MWSHFNVPLEVHIRHFWLYLVVFGRAHCGLVSLNLINHLLLAAVFVVIRYSIVSISPEAAINFKTNDLSVSKVILIKFTR
jgi:hypothetical protein